MKKIKTLFIIDYSTKPHTIHKTIRKGYDWVVSGESLATVKYDGTCAMVKDNKLWKRYDRKTKKSKRKYPKGYIFKESDLKNPPSGFIPCEENPDLVTGHHPGWVPVDFENPNDKWFKVAWKNSSNLENGTYELIGKGVNGNPYNLNTCQLIKHGENIVIIERTFKSILQWLKENNHEGLVFHHPNGDMCKIRRKDFHLEWNK